jgi:putative DNA primase/helicase
MVNATLAAALDYAGHGFSVIPFQRVRKAPALRRGEIARYRAQAAPVRRLRRWFAGDRHNVGLVTGARWRLLVLDVDGEEGLRSMRGLPNPPTPRVLTRRGYHAWFRYDGPPRATRIKALPGLDILVDNWQVLAPPSVHPNGTAYAWQEMLTLTDLSLALTPA